MGDVPERDAASEGRVSDVGWIYTCLSCGSELAHAFADCRCGSPEDVEAEPRGAVITSRGITRAAAASGAFDHDAEVQS